MIIEVATCMDIKELYELQLLAFESEAEMIGSRSVPALMETYQHAVSDFENWNVFKTLNDSGKIIASIRSRSVGNYIDVGRLMVHPDYRARGIASALLNEVDKLYPGKILELYTCTKSNTNIRLYERAGYKTYKEEKGSDDLFFFYMRKRANDILG